MSRLPQLSGDCGAENRRFSEASTAAARRADLALQGRRVPRAWQSVHDPAATARPTASESVQRRPFGLARDSPRNRCLSGRAWNATVEQAVDVAGGGCLAVPVGGPTLVALVRDTTLRPLISAVLARPEF
jgi:hypothetical protein